MTEKLLFHCRVCGKECDTHPSRLNEETGEYEDEQAVCEEHCEDHDYVYDEWDRHHNCKHCNKPAPDDWYDVEP